MRERNESIIVGERKEKKAKDYRRLRGEKAKYYCFVRGKGISKRERKESPKVSKTERKESQKVSYSGKGKRAGENRGKETDPKSIENTGMVFVEPLRVSGFCRL